VPITTLDPMTALLVIDLQKGVLAMPIEPSPAGVVANSVRLLEAFRAQGLPVVLVNVDAAAPGRTDQNQGAPAARRPDGWTELAPELDAQPTDHRITKKTWGAFHGTGLNEHLRELGVTQVVISGIATSAGVESTARQAHEHGFHVTLATDAMTDRSPAVHAHSVEQVFPRLGEAGTTIEILAVLEATRRPGDPVTR
jgi:nicotinamidase-related amidase